MLASAAAPSGRTQKIGAPTISAQTISAQTVSAQTISAPMISAQVVRKTLAVLGPLVAGERVLVLIPDHTRTIPLPMLFAILSDVLAPASHVTVMVALGTHPPLDDGHLLRLVGISADEREEKYAHIQLVNHDWADEETFATIDTIPADEVRAIAGARWHPSLDRDITVRINRAAVEADRIVIVGPTFPHEVVGYSGGSKYLFPGISGPEMIDATHWLGALGGVVGTIGHRDTPVRALIERAVQALPTTITLVALVVHGDGLAAMFVGDHREAWEAAVDESEHRHVVALDRPYNRVISCAAPMYDELWTAAKAMYKLEEVVADGGELVIYSPTLATVSQVHGAHIAEVGYHVLPYFLAQWERFAHIPLGVLAHSTHVRGAGTYRDGVEQPRVRVTLATAIPEAECRRLNLGYADPAVIAREIEELTARAIDTGVPGDVLVVPKAGETLYRLRPGALR